MTPAPSVVIVDPYTTASSLAPRFSARGYHTVAVVTDDVPPDLYLSSYHPEYFDLVLPHTRDVAELVAGLRPFAPVAVLAGAETGVELADALADRVSPLLANPTRSSSARRHKGDMARRVAAAGLAHIRTIGAADQDQVADWLDRHGLHGRDLAVKPPRAGGANGLAICRAGQGWRDEFERVLREPDYYRNVNSEVIVQEWVRGTEYAVDTMSLHGRHVVTGISRYDKVINAAHPAVYRAVEFIAPDGLDELVGYVRQVLDALEVSFGPAHTEVMVTEAGPVLIETGARLAGGGLAEVSAMATDIDPVELLVSLVDGGDLPDRDYRLVLPAMLRYVLVQTGGTVRNAEVLGELKSLSSYYTMSTRLVTGERAAATTDLLASTRAGWVLLANTNATALAADLTRADEVLSRLIID